MGRGWDGAGVVVDDDDDDDDNVRYEKKKEAAPRPPSPQSRIQRRLIRLKGL